MIQLELSGGLLIQFHRFRSFAGLDTIHRVTDGTAEYGESTHISQTQWRKRGKPASIGKHDKASYVQVPNANTEKPQSERWLSLVSACATIVHDDHSGITKE